MRTRRFKTTPDYLTGLRHARGVFRRFAETRRAFAEAIALNYLRHLKRGGTYTETVRVHGRDVTFDLLDFYYTRPASLQEAPMAWRWMAITLPYAATAGLDAAFLVEVQADIDYQRAARNMVIATYRMEPHALIAAAIRMKAAVLTAHWKRPVGLKVAKWRKPSRIKEWHALYERAGGTPAKETPA